MAWPFYVILRPCAHECLPSKPCVLGKLRSFVMLMQYVQFTYNKTAAHLYAGQVRGLAVARDDDAADDTLCYAQRVASHGVPSGGDGALQG